MSAAAELIKAKIKAMDEELKFLRYFYNRAGDYMGLADGDIYDEIKRNFKQDNGSIPDKYKYDFEEYPDPHWDD